MRECFSESVIEQAALAWLEGSDWRGTHGPENRDTLQHALTMLRVPDAERIVGRCI